MDRAGHPGQELARFAATLAFCALSDPAVARFGARPRMELDAEVDRADPTRWIGKIEVTTTDGRVLHARVDEPKGDPGNTLTAAEVERKALRLGAYRDGASAAEMRAAVDTIRGLASAPRMSRLLP